VAVDKTRTRNYGATRGGMSAFEQANQAALKRETEIRGLLDQIIGTYAPGGAYLKGSEAMLEREKQKYLGSATQNLISSGLYGTTMTAGLPKKWEEEVGIPSRLKLEDLRTQAYTGALGQKADFINQIQENVPSYETIANLTAKSQTAEPSLSQWLAQNFGSVPQATTTPKTQTGQTAEAMQRIKERLAAYQAPKVSYTQPLYGTVESERKKLLSK